MENDSQPTVVAHSFLRERGTEMVFNLPTREFSVKGYSRQIQRVLNACNGLRNLSEVRKVSGLEEGIFSEIVNFLESQEIICDAREMYLLGIRSSAYPMLAGHNHGPDDIVRLTKAPHRALEKGHRVPLPEVPRTRIGDLLRERGSCRVFRDAPVQPSEIAGLMDCMYGGRGRLTRTVPSPGGLYPLMIYLLILRDDAGFKRGAYRYDPQEQELILLDTPVPHEYASVLMDSSSILENSTAVVFIAADVARTARKYANRALRYVPLEVGHAAQNAYLYCSERKLGVVEYGGFNDELVAKALSLEYPRAAVFSSLVIGTPDFEASKAFTEAFVDEQWGLQHNLVGTERPVSSYGFTTHSYRDYTMPRYIGWAQYRSPHPKTPKSYARYNRSTGTGLSIAEATLKAIAESYERYCSGVIRYSERCTESDLQAPVLDLCKNAPLRQEYLDRMDLVRRTPDDVIEWVQLVDLGTESPLYTPVDQVFYPMFSRQVGRKLNYLANSTGVAAHFDRNEAVDRGLIELIERDAIAVRWYAKQTPNRISADVIPPSLMVRLEHFKKETGRSIEFLDLTLDSLPVIGCAISGPSYPRLTLGFGAGSCPMSALEKALDEAELIFHSWRGRSAKRERVVAKDVFNVLNHIQFWGQEENAAHIRWFLEGKFSGLPESSRSIDEAKRLFRPAVVDLTTESAGSGLHVVRVCSGELMPINFGYMSEHYRHPRVLSLGYSWGWPFPATPHCLA